MRVRNIDTDLLRTFVALVELGGFTRAGEALGRSQPAISLQVKRLEETVGVALLHRETRDVRLTPQGEILLAYARRILRLHDEALAALGPSDGGATVRVGIPNDFAGLLLPPVLAEFAANHPDVQMTVTCELSASLLDRLARGELDVVVAMHRDHATSPAAMLKAWTERLVWVGAAGHAPWTRSPLPLAAYPDGCAYRRAMTRALDRAERPWRIVFDSPSLFGLQAAIQAGLAITVMAERTVPAGLVALPPSTGLPGLADMLVGLHFDPTTLSDAGRMLVRELMAHATETLGADTHGGVAAN